jgi:hypothetical protein
MRTRLADLRSQAIVSDDDHRPDPKCLPLKPLTVTVKVAREVIGTGATKMWELIREGEVETIKIGRRTLVIFASLENLIARKKGRT